MPEQDERRMSDNYDEMQNSSAHLPDQMRDIDTILDPDPDPDRDPQEIQDQSMFGLRPDDQYTEQGPMGDLDENDPYSNLHDDGTDDDLGDLDRTPGGDGLYSDEQPYGLDQPLAGPGDKSLEGSERDPQGTRVSQDQEGYQK